MPESDSKSLPSAVAVFPEVVTNACKPATPALCRVKATESCAASRKAAGFTRHIEIDVSGTPLEGKVMPGQAIGIMAPGIDSRGRPHAVRLYSVCSPTGGETADGTIVATTVKRLIDEHTDDHSLFLGVASNYLCNLQVGDEVAVTGPTGKRFLLPESPELNDYVFFATGTGIAPFRGFLIDLLERAECQSQITLVMGAPYATDLLYHNWLSELALKHERFTYLTAISRQQQDDTPQKLYVQDRIAMHPEHFRTLMSNPRTLAYVCGIAGMEFGIFEQMMRVLDPETLSEYVQIDPAVASDPSAWTRKMMHRQIKTTKRMLLEVYA